MSAAPVPTSPSGSDDERRRRRQTRVMVGLGLTLVGLALLISLVPSNPGFLSWGLLTVAAGILALWVGGILLGLGGLPRRRRREG
jgi:hypothetical protein